MIASLLTAISAKYELRRGNGRWSGPCPKCGGKKGSDKFRIKDDGGFKCFACGWGGDIITWLREMDGMTCPEAHEAAGLPCRADGCSVRSTCRMGDGSGRRQTLTGRSVTPPARARETALPVINASSPAEIWLAWAEKVVTLAAKTLANCPDVLRWLAARGIDAEAAGRHRLGWLGHDAKVNRAAIGLPPKDGKPTLWVPGGLVIPTFGADGRIHRLRIRRTNESRERFLPDLKYVWIEGSGTAPMLLPAAGRCRGAVIVEAELDAIACDASHQQIMAIAVGTVSGGLTEAMREQLRQAPTILVALDADHGKDGRPGAGPKQLANWQREYRQAQYWPVPTGKDPGDYAKAGGSLRKWLESGLVPEIAAPGHDLSFSPGSIPPGGEGEQKDMPPAPVEIITEDTAEPVARIITLLDGRELHVTDSQQVWSELTAEGKICFSENELKRLQVACGAMNDEDRTAAAMLAVDVKEQFAGAYIRRGEVTA